jgi:peptidoglycan/xylan/chitin deacetylase (PgdA/CDA1 family)
MIQARDNFLVLTGHGIGCPPGWLLGVDPEMWITWEQFDRTLQHISDSIRLTFDDGFSCCWDIAFPELQRRGMVATFFVLAGMLGKQGYLTEDQVVEMHRAGMPIGTHGMYHRPWRKLEPDALHEEIFEAKERLEGLLGNPITEAACPLGAYDRRSLSALKRSGIERVYTSDRALPDKDSWIVPRYTLRRSDSPSYLKEVVARRKDASLLGRAKMVLKRYR